jgi:hypothetical protein
MSNGPGAYVEVDLVVPRQSSIRYALVAEPCRAAQVVEAYELTLRQQLTQFDHLLQSALSPALEEELGELGPVNRLITTLLARQLLDALEGGTRNCGGFAVARGPAESAASRRTANKADPVRICATRAANQSWRFPKAPVCTNSAT